jgi:hypothetical protein
MLDHALESALLAVLQCNAMLAGIAFFTGHDSDEHGLPAVTLSSKSEPLAGSSEVFRSELSLIVESEAHDNSPDEHAALVEKVRSSFTNRVDVAARINAGNAVYVYGYAFSASALEVDGTRFRTTLTLKVGYGIP